MVNFALKSCIRKKGKSGADFFVNLLGLKSGLETVKIGNFHVMKKRGRIGAHFFVKWSNGSDERVEKKTVKIEKFQCNEKKREK